MDVGWHYEFSKDLRVGIEASNLLSDESIAGRHPYGARPDAPMTFTADLKFSF